jgi:hypothetical protein
VKKSVVDFELLHVPPPGHNKREETLMVVNDHGAESVIVIDDVALLEAFGDETGLVALDAAVRVVLDLEDPTVVDEVDARRCRDETPCLVAMKGSELSIHGSPLAWIIHRSSDRGWLKVGRADDSIRDSAVCALLRLRESGVKKRPHGMRGRIVMCICMWW